MYHHNTSVRHKIKSSFCCLKMCSFTCPVGPACFQDLLLVALQLPALLRFPSFPDVPILCLGGKQGLGSASLSVVQTQLDWRGQLCVPSLLFGFPEKPKITIGECCPNLGFIGANLPLCNHYRQSCVLPLILAVCNSLIIPYQWRTSHGDQGGTGELQRSTCLVILSKTF